MKKPWNGVKVRKQLPSQLVVTKVVRCKKLYKRKSVKINLPPGEVDCFDDNFYE